MTDYSNILQIRAEPSVSPNTPEILYHYTTVHALKCIVEGRKMRATHYKQLNDETELRRGIKLLTKLIRNNNFPGSYSGLINKMQEILDGKSRRNDLNTYIISFSERGNSLSQWRAYTDMKDGGVAIGFLSRSLLYDLRVETPVISECHKDRNLLHGIVSIMGTKTKKYGEGIPEGFLLDTMTKLLPCTYGSTKSNGTSLYNVTQYLYGQGLG